MHTCYESLNKQSHDLEFHVLESHLHILSQKAHATGRPLAALPSPTGNKKKRNRSDITPDPGGYRRASAPDLPHCRTVSVAAHAHKWSENGIKARCRPPRLAQLQEDVL